MKRALSVILATTLWLAPHLRGQSFVPIDTSQESAKYWEEWLKDLGEMGVQKRGDSLILSEEVVRLLKDSVYRNSIYPDEYTWPLAVELLQKMELKKAFWHLINLYRADTLHRNLVVGTFAAYDSVMDVSKVLLSTFYTYAFTDPDCSRMKDGRPDIHRPDIMESKLRSTKEIIGYIWEYRKRKEKGRE